MNLAEDLKGKIVVVTGAARGIGFSVAEGFAGCGSQVVASDIDPSIAEKASSFGGFGIRADISDPHQVQKMVDACLEKFGPPDVLVNVAAISTPCLVKDMSLDRWQNMLRVNLTSVFHCTTAVLPYMLQKNKGAVISFSSSNAAMGGRMSAHYAAAKGGIEAFSRSLAMEVGPKGIRVNVVSPGMIDTPMMDLMPPAQKATLVARLPLPRLGRPVDVVKPVLFLASDAAAYITGQTLHINGGLYMQ